jgi:hypothetical protein
MHTHTQDTLITHASVLLLAATLCLLGACAQPASSAMLSAYAAASVQPGSGCDRQLLSLGNVAGILRAPLIVSAGISGDPQSCTLQTASFPSLR